jgi:hypothetical protein
MERTGINDLVLVYFEDEPMTFARVEEIREDYKKGWYHVSLLFLQVPLQVVTWILRDQYIDGGEFTMNGKRIRLEKVISPHTPAPEPEDDTPEPPPPETPPTEKGKVISFKAHKK